MNSFKKELTNKYVLRLLNMCDNPLIALRLGVDLETGKYKIKLKRPPVGFSLNDMYQKYGKENVLLIPCGHCSSCVLSRRREWSIRCQCEAFYHDENCFVTLTYDDEHLPGSMNQVKKDLKKFIKSIRNSGYKVRYFGCGERGELNNRLHAHIILFGFMPNDLYYVGTSDSNEAIFESNFIDSIWAKGRSIVQFFDGSVGSYVAGYTSKKLGDKSGFQIQSTHPGLGFHFAKDNFDFFVKYDRMYGSFGSAKLPRYFEKVLFCETKTETDSEGIVRVVSPGTTFILDLLKDERLKKANSSLYQQARNHGFSNLEEAIFYQRHFADGKLAALERSL